MKTVVGVALRKALASLVLCFGLFAPLFIGLGRKQEAVCTSEPHFPESPGCILSPHSPWDFSIAIGLVAVSVLVAVLIYPRGRSRTAPLPVPTSPR
jgi:hypothetical protein